MQLLKDKVIFLTGGSMGIGLECAKKYLGSGARVMIMSNDQSSLDKAVNITGISSAHACCGDVSAAADVEIAIKRTIEQFGRIDVIHNNAGIASPSAALHDTTDSEWTRLFEVNVRSILLTTRYGLAELKKTQGTIINTSSLVGEIGQDNHAAYAATKGAVNALTKSMALDYAPFGIRVNAVAPAGVWTGMLRTWVSEQADPSGMTGWLNRIHPLGYCPEGDVIGDACVYLASSMSAFITGTILPVSGGAELGYRSLKPDQ